MANAPFTPASWTDQPLVVYHGTTDATAASILSTGVSISHGLSRTDFGPGFYTTTVERQARSWAWQRSQRAAGSRPAVLRFDIDRDRLSALDGMAFVRCDFHADEFWSLVAHCRSGANHHARPGAVYYDVVYGPVAAFWRQRSSIHDADQVSFHTSAAEML